MTEQTTDDTAPVVGEGDDSAHPQRHTLRNWLIVIVVALVVAVGVRAYVFESFFVPSGSMIPTIEIGDHMIVDKLSYHLHSVGFGNIIVFHKPADDHTSANIHYLVKRVIGLPGQTIWFHDGQVYINGKLIAEPFLPKGVKTYPLSAASESPIHIPKNEYYVLGDNRGDSADSRVFGPISRSLIVGRVILIYWPLSQWHYF
ncbi:MAG: signal peptidase I [Ferrimicrobium sp.]